jgi:predicted  nucleic acid-binding Zn-ribbon protein
MNKDQMLQTLYTEYHETALTWAEQLGALNAALNSYHTKRDLLKQLQDDLALMEAHAILGETHKEGAINGSNSDKRKLQTTALLGNLAKLDPEWKALTEQTRQVEEDITDAEIALEKAKAHISYLRNQARMVAGLAHALGG